MPAERIGMRDAREIIRLKFSSVSTHEIARRLGMARSTVRETLKRARSAGLDPQAVDRLDILIRESLSEQDAAAMMELVRNRKYRVDFGIVTRKDPLVRSLTRLAPERCARRRQGALSHLARRGSLAAPCRLPKPLNLLNPSRAVRQVMSSKNG